MKKFIAFLCIAVMLCSITSVSLAANKTVRRTEQRPASGHLETVKTFVPAHYTIINNTKNDLGNGLCLVTIDIIEPSQTKNINQTTSVLDPLNMISLCLSRWACQKPNGHQTTIKPPLSTSQRKV